MIPVKANQHTYSLRKEFRAMGGQWDKPTRCWMFPAEVAAKAQEMADEATAAGEQKIEADRPRLLALDLERAHERLKASQELFDHAKKHLAAANRRYIRARIAMIRETSEVEGIENLKIGFHECTSPIGVCVYDEEDVCRDTCLFCGDPEERK